jgi:hypothetical protein
MKHKIFHFWPTLAMLAFIAVFSCAVMLLWNWLLPSLVGLPEITFLQALGLLALSRILLGGLGGWERMLAAHTMHDRDHMNPLREKWGKMAEEERYEFLRKHNPLYQHFFGARGLHEDEPAPNKDTE